MPAETMPGNQPRSSPDPAAHVGSAGFARWLDRQASIESFDKVFVVGCYKSGTTWLQRLLDEHPEMVVKGEGCAGWKLVPLLHHALGEYNKHQVSHGYTKLTCIENSDCMAMFRAAINAQLGNYLDRASTESSQVRIVGDKTPQHAVCRGVLSGIYPKARFVHIVRDPRDAAVSSWFHGDPLRFGSSIEAHTEAFLKKNWPVNVRSALQSAQSLNPDRFCEVRYEDLLTDPDAELARMFAFCNVDDSPETINACKKACSFLALSNGRSNGEEQRGHFFRKGIAGDWKNHLDPEQVAPHCVSIKDLMDRYRYEI